MLKIWKTESDHEQIFIQRYEQMFSWAMKLCGHSRQLAEDLVHDAFIQFVHLQPDLGNIKNLEGYLYTMLRNMYLSHIRRSARSPTGPLSTIDYDSVEIALRGADLHRELRMRDELRMICRYACVRKETSRAGSVLILRFFHGYFPGEIARILRTTRPAVAELLRVARQEVNVYLSEPRRLSFMRGHLKAAAGSVLPAPAPREAHSSPSPCIISELQQEVSRSRIGGCISSGRLQELYRSESGEGMSVRTLAHIVSCPECLDKVNRLLGLPPLNDRYPTDTLGPDTRAPGGSGPPQITSSTAMKLKRRRIEEVTEHYPRELHISVNGYIIGTQKIGGELSEFSLSIEDDERVEFIEVFSEQGIRLLFHNVDLPPEGAFQQQTLMRFTEGRHLEADLSFCGPWPNLKIVYSDPLWNSACAWNSAYAARFDGPELSSPASPEAAEEVEAARRATGDEFVNEPAWWNSWLARLARGLGGLSALARPGPVAVMLTLLLISAVLLFKPRVSPVSAAELLSKVSASEKALFSGPDVVIHRTLYVEERSPGKAEMLSVRRVEVWSSAQTGIKARRVYDKENNLIAGEWVKPDGSKTLYHRGSKPERSSPADAREAPAMPSIEAGNIWRIDPSAESFTALVSSLDGATVEEKSGNYIIRYRAGGEVSEGKLLKAMLVVRKADLRPVEQMLVVHYREGDREHRIRESGFERVPVDKVDPEVFRLNPGLAGPGASRPALPSEPNDAESSDAAAMSPRRLSLPELAALEIEAEYRLHQLGVCLREQSSMTRSVDEGLRIQVVVGSDKRKAEILSSLNPLAEGQPVKLEIETFAEAIKNQAKMPPAPVAARRIQITEARIPVYAQLRQHFSERAGPTTQENGSPSADDRVDQDIRRFAGGLLSDSRRALLHAYALKHISDKTSSAEFQSLGGQAKERWLLMVSEHAARLQQETRSVRLQLQPVFFSSGGDTAADGEPGQAEPSSLKQAIEQLFESASATDQVIRSTFAVSEKSRATSIIKTSQFWNALTRAERLAGRLRDFQ